MPAKATPHQMNRIKYLLHEVASDGIDEDEQSLIEESAGLTASQRILWLELREDEDWIVTPGAVIDLEGLGYSSAADLRAVSRLASGTPSPASLISAIGLRHDRAQDLLEVTPEGTALISPGDDKDWTRAILTLPLATLQPLLAETTTRTALWMSVVSAHSPTMKRRIEKFTDAGAPFIPWIISGHSVEDLLEALDAPLPSHADRALIHGAVRSLDRRPVPEEGEE